MGALLTGFLARNAVNPNLATNLKDYVKDSLFQPLVLEQLKAIALTLTMAIVGTTILAFIVKAIVGLRVSPEIERVRPRSGGTWRGRLPLGRASYDFRAGLSGGPGARRRGGANDRKQL